jgi:hypothetical protein
MHGLKFHFSVKMDRFLLLSSWRTKRTRSWFHISMVLVGTGHAISEKFATVLLPKNGICITTNSRVNGYFGTFLKNQDAKRALGIIVSRHLSKCLK